MESHVFLLGTRIDNYTMNEAVDRTGQLLAQGDSHYIVTPNPEILLRAYRDNALRLILNESSLSLCDGTGAYLAALCMGKRFQERVTGVDFMQALCGHAAAENKTVALIGGERRVRARAKELLQQVYPDLTISSMDENNPRGKADIAFVALGSPRQEYWMAEQKQRGCFNVMVGVGGAFDMLSGKLTRAPKIMRRMGIEWAWRFLLEPQRARRIVSAVIIFPYVFLRSRGL